jgi:hypothetical protein
MNQFKALVETAIKSEDIYKQLSANAAEFVSI